MHTANPFTLMEHLATQTRLISQHYHHPMYHTLQHGVSTTVHTPIHHPRSDATQQSKDPLANHKLFTWSLHTTVLSHTRINRPATLPTRLPPAYQPTYLPTYPFTRPTYLPDLHDLLTYVPTRPSESGPDKSVSQRGLALSPKKGTSSGG